MDDYSHTSAKAYEFNNDHPNKLHLRDPEPQMRHKTPRPFSDNLKEFMSNTTLHGFRYMIDKQFTWVERLWWMIMVTCSILACAFFIRKVWIKRDETPVIVSFADTSKSVWDIPFPAVTICTETKPRQRVFNFTKAYFDRWSDPPTISPEDLQTYQDMLLLCNYAPSEGPDFVNASAIETLQRLAPTIDEVFMECLWTNLTCSQMFTHTLTKDGYCFTFNMLSAEEMFRTENLHKDYYHVAGKNTSQWSLGRGYPLNATIDTYPLRGPSYGGVEFEVIMLTDIRDLDQVCRGPVQGFKVWLHNPAELPNMGQNFFRLPIQHQSAAAVVPRVMDTGENLRDYLPHNSKCVGTVMYRMDQEALASLAFRNDDDVVTDLVQEYYHFNTFNTRRMCYFPEERYLSFFRTYTQRNCELECSSNHTALRCGCVPLYMPHGPDTKVCGGGKQICVREALEELSLSKSSLRPESKEEVNRCDCLQACTELKYDAEVSQAVYDLTTYRRNANPDIAQGLRLPSGLVIYFSEDLFTTLRRSELYGSVDFVANCGGIMGLFMGFSFLSLIELVYYFTMRLWCTIRKSSVVVAAT